MVNNGTVRNCEYCGKSFEWKTKNQKYCCKECREQAILEKNQASSKMGEKEFVIKVCKCCKKEFECSRRTPNKVFCSKECTKAYYKEKASQNKKEVLKEEKKCEYCGKVFIWESIKSNQKFCSNECTMKYMREKTTKAVIKESRNCAFCGKTFEWSSSKPNQKYCSNSCLKDATYFNIKSYRKNSDEFIEKLRSRVYLHVTEIIGYMRMEGDSFNGKYIDYWQVGDISEKTREEVLNRDNYECKICRRKENLHLHHLIKRKNGGNHKADNLVTLCASCHRHIETGDIDHATNKCLKNAKKYYDLADGNDDVLDVEYAKELLNNLFDKLKDKDADDSELLVKLDDVIEMLGTE